jgi:hypothetical protein
LIAEEIMRDRSLPFVLTLSLFATSVAAQDTRKVGLVIAYPAAAGLILHAGDRVAVRPDLSFSNTSLQTTPSSITQHSSTIGAGISALFYLTRWEALRAYVSPRYGYNHTWGTSSTIATNSTSHSSTTAITGSFGAQYALGDRFSVFAETGFGYNTTKNTNESPSPSSLPVISNKIHGWATRSGLGAILYF